MGNKEVYTAGLVEVRAWLQGVYSEVSIPRDSKWQVSKQSEEADKRTVAEQRLVGSTNSQRC